MRKKKIQLRNLGKCNPDTGCCTPNPESTSRRDFIKKAALGTGAFALPGIPVFAGPFTFNEQDHLVPEDKRLTEKWIQSLYDHGYPEVFTSSRGELKYIGMPIGGIACGQLYLGGDGRLWLWHIFKTEYGREKDHGQRFASMTLGGHYANPDQVFTRENRPVHQGTAIRIRYGGNIITKRLDATGFNDIQFRGEYPIGKIKYKDEGLPVDIGLEAFSPFIPVNPEDSALPLTIMSYKVKNTSTRAIEVEMASWLENAVCPYSDVKSMGVRRNTLIKGANRLTILSTAEALSENAKSLKEDVVFEDFESGSYKRWKATGEAFGNSSIKTGEEGFYEKGQMGDYYVSSSNARNLEDKSNASTYQWGRIIPSDVFIGTLTSKPFTITHNYITFLMAGGYHSDKTAMNLLVDNQVVLSLTSNNTTTFEERFLDVRNYSGKKARLQIVDDQQGSWGSVAIDHIVFTDKEPLHNDLKDLHGYGSMALSLYQANENSKGALNITGEISPDNILSALTDVSGSATSSFDAMQVGTLGESFILQPGEENEVTFIITWFFPHFNQQETERGELLQLKDIKILKKHYANWFTSANQVADYVCNDFDRLAGTTRKWNRTYYDSTLPYWLLDRSFISLDCLASNTFLWFDNGRVWGWEGVECCQGTCQHVWQYAQGMARIFPQLERTIREVTDFGYSFREDGGFGHRDETAGDYGRSVAQDGHCGTVMRVYREHKMSSDNRFLKKHYRKIKKSVQYLINEDKDKDGLLEGAQHNTLDAAWYGPMGWISSLYIGAMAAGKEMALEVGDNDFAAECDALIQKGKQNLVSRLFNGEYFIHEPDLAHPNAINSNDGCHIDQVLGQSFAWQTGIPTRVVPEKECESALESIWKYNFAPDAFLYQEQHKPIKGARIYATEGEAGTIMCTWPKSKGGETAVPGMAGRSDDSELWLGPGAYFDEAMNGFEYQVASHMIWEGMLEKGLATARVVHDRYNPLRRNPYNEIECSDHYSRSMASYGVFVAVCGFDYHGPRGYLSFAPKITPESFKAPFTVAEGWGSFEQSRSDGLQINNLTMKSGRLRLNEFAVQIPDGANPLSATLYKNGEEIRAAGNLGLNNKYAVIMEELLNEGDTLQLKLKLH